MAMGKLSLLEYPLALNSPQVFKLISRSGLDPNYLQNKLVLS